MTSKEAAEILQSMKSDFPLPKAAQTRRAQNEALDVAIEALKAEPYENAMLRRYTFANNEFSLEAAYHDCKFVFDGITDDDSFQEADAGLVFYYANEIIYALHEALQSKDTNVGDTISRKAAIDVIEAGRLTKLIDAETAVNGLKALPPAQPERKQGKWIYHIDDIFPAESTMECNQCHAEQPLTCDDEYCPHCGAKMEGKE